MKMKALFLSLLLAMLSSVGFAQSGYVTATATIPNYAGGQATASFVNQSSAPQLPLLNGSIFPTTAVQNLDVSGKFTMALADDLVIQPTPSQWQIIICAKAGNQGQPCFPVQLTITCVGNPSCSNGKLDISSAFNGAPAPPLPPGSLPIAQHPGQILTSVTAGANYALQPQAFYSQAGDTVSSIEAECSSPCVYYVTRPQTITLAANHTLSSNVFPVFTAGGVWTVNGAFTLTIPSQVQGSLTTHFLGSATVKFGKSQALVPVEWFGAAGDWNGSTGTDNAAALQDAVNSVNVGQILLQAKTYMTSAALTINRSQVGIIGTSPGFPNAAFFPAPSPSMIITSSPTADVLDASGSSATNTIMSNLFSNFTLARTAPTTAITFCFNLQFSFGARIDGVSTMDCTAGFNLHGVGSAGVGYIQNSAALWGFNGFSLPAPTSGGFVGFQVDSLDGTANNSLRIRNSLAVSNRNTGGAATFGLFLVGANTHDLMTDHFETASLDFGVKVASTGAGFFNSSDIHLMNGINDGCFVTCITVTGIQGAVEINGGWNSTQASVATPLIDVEQSSHVDITNLQLVHSGTGIVLQIVGPSSGSIRVSHNDFTSGHNSAISFNNVNESIINGNIMNGFTATTIVDLVNSSGNVISSNEINGTATNGIALDSNSNGNTGLETNLIGAGAIGVITNPISDNGSAGSPTRIPTGLITGMNGSTYRIRQAVRVTGSPLCTAAANALCSFILTWPKPFPDANWAGICTVEAVTGAGVLGSLSGKTATTATGNFLNLTAATNTLSTVSCEGWE